MKILRCVLGASFILNVALVGAQWDPANGQWLKTEPTDLRIMTWNVQDGICTSNDKLNNLGDWNGLVRTVAALKPDILILQETADNSGNGTGSGIDSVGNMRTVLDLFFRGGVDPFRGGNVTSYVQLYDPNFDMPFDAVSGASDGFNRNIIVSRFRFTDLNGDGVLRYNDMRPINPVDYAPGGNGGIRGFQFGEIDLDDDVYAGDVVIGNTHLKSGFSGSDLSQRLVAAQNVAYYVHHFYNGDGSGSPDPDNKIFDSPAATDVLDDNTGVILGGDWNEDEQTNGRKGPADWLTLAQFSGANQDGTDKDNGDMSYDNATNVFTGSRSTLGSGKLDYIAWQDSIYTLRRAFVFTSSGLSAQQMPPEIASFGGNAALMTPIAADHRPVVVDLILPLVQSCPGDVDGNGEVDLADLSELLGNFGSVGQDIPGDLDGNGTVDLTDLSDLLANFGNTCG